MSKHTPNLGFEYEVHLPAYFALVLNNNPDIEDFNLQSNVEEFGNLDDLLVQIRKKNGEELRFAFQLKHKNDGHKHLLPSNFEAKGDFNVEKYCLAFKNLNEKNKKYNFILFTNKHFDASRVEEVANFKMKMDDQCPGRIFFDTSQDCGALYKFEVSDATEDGKYVTKEDYRKFFSKFTLYTGQANFNDLDQNLLDDFEFKEPCLKYIDFFRRWHRKEFSNKILDKKTLNIQLIEFFLAPFIMESFQLPYKNFEQAVKEFDVTVLEDSSCDLFLQREEEEVEEDTFIRLAKECKIINRWTKQIDKSIKMKLLYYIFEKPLIVTVTEASKNLIYKAMEMFRMEENTIRFVFVGQKIDNEKFGSLKVFKNLQNLSTVNPCLYEEIINECVLSFQGRIKISFKKLIDDYKNIATLTSPTDLLQILHEDYLVGGKKETLSSYYMPRSISIKIQKLQLVLDRCIQTKELIIIFTKEFQNFTCLLPTQKVTFLSVQDFYDRRYIAASTIVLITDEHLSSDSFDKICNTYYKKCKKLYSKKDGNKKPAAYYFMLLNKEDLLLVMSSNKVSRSSISNLEKLSVNESAIDTYLRNLINILVSGAGMGKSTLFKKLKNDCFLDWWSFYLDLKLHNDFLKKIPNGVDVLKYLKKLEETANPDSFTQKILTVFLEEKKVVIFLDGVDEIESDSLEIVLDFTQELYSMGYHTWLTSRQNLKTRLEEKFNIFAVDIEELNQNDQKMYIRDKLQLKYQPEEIEKIIVNIFRNFDITNNFQILGIPLQLFIITEILINDRKNFQHEDNMFVLTKMYRMFIEGRYRHVIDKTNSQNSHLLPLDIEDLLEKYALLALHSLFPEDTLWVLSFDTRKITRILTKIKKEKDSLGIVLEVNSEGKAVFEHVTFAEYFACYFLANNHTEAEILKSFLFSEEYENLLRMLNIMLAEDSKLHLAVIYKDLNQIKALLEDKDNSPWCVDKGGRNLLHILSCISTRYPHLNFTKDGEYIEIDDLAIKNFERESSVIMEILTLLLDLDVNWFENDNIFFWDPLSYAANFGALYIAEALCERFFNHITFVHYFQDTLYFLYYSLKFGYTNLLKKVFSNKRYLSFDKITCKSLSDDESHSVIRLVVQTACNKQNEILDILDRSLEVVTKNPEFCSVAIKTAESSTSILSLPPLKEERQEARVLEPQNYIQQVISTNSPRNGYRQG